MNQTSAGLDHQVLHALLGLAVLLLFCALVVLIARAVLRHFYDKGRWAHLSLARERAGYLATHGARVVDNHYAIISGRVRRVRSVSVAVAHVELDGLSDLIEVIAYHWAISTGDQLEMAVMSSPTGRLQALAHQNLTNKTSGSATPPSGRWLLILMAVVSYFTIVIPILLIGAARQMSWQQADIEGAHAALFVKTTTPYQNAPQLAVAPGTRRIRP